MRSDSRYLIEALLERIHPGTAHHRDRTNSCKNRQAGTQHHRQCKRQTDRYRSLDGALAYPKPFDKLQRPIPFTPEYRMFLSVPHSIGKSQHNPVTQRKRLPGHLFREAFINSV